MRRKKKVYLNAQWALMPEHSRSGLI